MTVGSAQLALDEVGQGPLVVFLHAGVADRRSWAAQLTCLACTHRSVAYDRRGFGFTTYDPDEPFSHVDDLLAVIGDRGPAILVGNSQGGRIAVNCALRAPEQVAGLVLVATALSGWSIDEATDLTPRERELDAAIEQADADGDRDQVNALEAWLWLDGPEQAEGRVSAARRDLFLDMNGRALAAATPTAEQPPPSAVARLGQITAPTLLIDGALDLAYIRARSALMAAKMPNARHATVAGAAHLVAFEAPDDFNQLLLDFVTAISRG